MFKTACAFFLLALSAGAQQLQQLQPLGIGLEAVPYPWPVRFIPLNIEGQDLRMSFMDIPALASPNGRVAVLMHGKNFGGYYFADVANMLSAVGYRVIVPDQIGWGRSSKPDIPYTFNMLAANTAHLLDTLGIDKVTVLGHSTGGMLAVRFALMYPQRTSALVLEGPLGMEDYRVGPAQTLEELYQNELHNDPDKIRGVFVKYFATDRRDIWEPLAEIPLRVLLSPEYPRWAKASALAYQMIYQQPVRYEYKDLKPPVLIIVGDKDHTAPVSPKASPEQRAKLGNFPELARAAARDIPHGEAVIIENCGHIPHLEKPEEFRAALLKFLK
jgi:pimeloyl-ACP methyl ester carboxylesterase